jgi:transglutaminase-like putative cysteine protease
MAKSSSGALGFVFKALAVFIMILAPLLGVWIASSLAAYLNGRIWVPLVAGFALFPGLPLAWDGWAQWQRARNPKAAARKRFLTFGDRLTLRTLAVSAVFLVVLLACYPERAFVALASRGDWMLGARHGPTIDAVRRGLFAAAGGLEWLYRASHKNPYEDESEDRHPDGTTPTPGPAGSNENERPSTSPAPASAPTQAPTSPATAAPAPSSSSPAPVASASTSGSQSPPPSSTSTSTSLEWPLSTQLHPLVQTIPPEAEKTIADVAHYVAAREPDETQRFKALHDWVADRIAYDADAYLHDRVTWADADPKTVFDKRVGVCAGYAKVLQALGKAAGLDVVYVSGDARDQQNPVAGHGHAWNAVRLHGKWYLADATWDAGSLAGDTFEKSYSSEYLLTPPEVFGVDHFPKNPEWQLRKPSLPRGEFFRQPVLRPSFFARGLRLVSPDRSQVESAASLDVVIENGGSSHLLIEYSAKDAASLIPCEGDGLSRANCSFPGDGVYDVSFFAGERADGHFTYVGSVEATSRR